MPEENTPFEKACTLFAQANAEDPNKISHKGQELPRELAHAQWLAEWVDALAPQASEALRLAARCQHICRWEKPRKSYPMDRPGYLKWRADLKVFHAQRAGELLTEAGYDAGIIKRVQSLNLKKNLKNDPECQTIEDALCLVFLQYQFEEFLAKTEKPKVISILQKTWKKMSTKGQTKALKLNFSETALSTIQEALNTNN